METVYLMQQSVTEKRGTYIRSLCVLGLVKCTLYTSAKYCGMMNDGNFESKELCRVHPYHPWFLYIPWIIFFKMYWAPFCRGAPIRISIILLFLLSYTYPIVIYLFLYLPLPSKRPFSVHSPFRWWSLGCHQCGSTQIWNWRQQQRSADWLGQTGWSGKLVYCQKKMTWVHYLVFQAIACV